MRKVYDATIAHTTDTDCSIVFVNEKYVYHDLRVCFTNGAKVTIEIKSRRKPRSLRQNAYLHMCLQMIADETENDLDTVKSTVKAMYAKKPLLDKDGEPIYDKETGEQAMFVQDTKNMNTIEAMEFTEKVRMFSIDFCGLVLPLPEDQIDLKFKK